MCVTGREMDLRNTVKNGILYLEDPIDNEWNPHFFVLTQNKLLYTDSFQGNNETDTEDDDEETGFQRHKEVNKFTFSVFFVVTTILLSIIDY